MKLTLSLIMILGQCASVFSATSESVELKPTQVAVYKDGNAFITQKAKIGSDSLYLILHNIALPAYGTFWWSMDGSAQVKNLISKKIDKLQPKENFSFGELINDNLGKLVTLTYEGAGDKTLTVTGRVLGTPKSGKIKDSFTSLNIEKEKDTPEVQMIFMELPEKKLLVIQSDRVIDVQFSEEVKFPEQKISAVEVIMELLGSAQGQTLTTNSLSAGILWSPSYKLDITQVEKLSFKAQATVWNNLIDLKDVDLELTTGYPALLYKSVWAPFTLSQTMNDFLQSIEQGNNLLAQGHERSLKKEKYAMASDMQMAVDPFSSSSAPIAYNPAEVSDKNNMSYYKLSPFSCKKDDSVTVDIVSFETGYKMIYTVDLAPADVNRYFQNTEGEEKFDVWSSIVFKNENNQALTEAPVLFINGGNLIGQGSFSYTSQGAEAKVKMNKALDCQVTRKESMMKREQQEQSIKNIFNTTFFTYTINGDISIKNNSGKEITVDVKAQVPGVIAKESLKDGGVISQVSAGGYNPNPVSTVTWQVTLAPQEEVKRTYTYGYTMPR